MTTEIILAGIAAVVSFVGLVITKESKVSDFRQAWIKDLRLEFVRLFMGLDQLRVTECFEGKANTPECLLMRKDVVGHIWSIKLMLNPKEEEAMVALLDDLERIILGNKPLNNEFAEGFGPTENKLRESVQKILKTEWGRVKAGEPWFRATKWAILITMSLGIFHQIHLVFCKF